MLSDEINRFFCALVVSRDLRSTFLHPETRLKAINDGYGGEKFDLSYDEVVGLLSIQGENLTEIAANYLNLGKKGSERLI